jgi:protein TonB
MDAVLNWTYQKRDPISVGSALVAAIFVLLVINFASIPTTRPDENEMAAFLDVPPEVKPPPEPPKKVIQEQPPVVKQIQTTAPLSKNPDPVDTPLPPKVQEFHPSLPVAPTPPVAAATPVQAPIKSQPPVESSYVAELKAYLEKIKKYPSSREARLTHPQGTVVLSLLIARSGQLQEIRIVSTSHSNLLDGEAIKTIKAGSLPPFPEQAFAGESAHEFKVNMEYSIDP